ncbi:MAG: hypothetical protein WD066_04870, partial [Planctomycetaceae bacterium]
EMGHRESIRRNSCEFRYYLVNLEVVGRPPALDAILWRDSAEIVDRGMAGNGALADGIQFRPTASTATVILKMNADAVLRPTSHFTLVRL